MEQWRTRRADRTLRLLGLVLLAVAGVALRWLYGLHVPPQSAGVLAYGLAAIGYMAASSVAALVPPSSASHMTVLIIRAS